MSVTLAQLETQVLQVYKRTDKSVELDRAINETYEEMIGAIYPRKTQDQIYRPLVVNRDEYPLPDTVLRINHPIRLIDLTADDNASSSFPMKFITKEEYDLIEPNPDAATISNNGIPTKYTIFKHCVFLTPKPSRATLEIEINVGGSATRLVNAGDQSIFEGTWDETHKAGTLARMFTLVGLMEDANLWQKVYRYGFAGNEKYVTGGLELMRRITRDTNQAPLIVSPRYF